MFGWFKNKNENVTKDADMTRIIRYIFFSFWLLVCVISFAPGVDIAEMEGVLLLVIGMIGNLISYYFGKTNGMNGHHNGTNGTDTSHNNNIPERQEPILIQKEQVNDESVRNRNNTVRSGDTIRDNSHESELDTSWKEKRFD